ncbi:ABC transporter ATP-binding protein [Rathayibacter sp. Leaf296]|uniref:ABC transporter ATP-binding protein n=1 Tax=Rathayibacter sp. Leaf296 TaxID=1736327 RepID=UPI0007034A54|nr:ABC transporter ATP-binding protein [Rathayibacter sp. Leaf296]KQQ08514.1 hypothetical protein ASF46_14550 [Rathayibacter sp. Leaf296]
MSTLHPPGARHGISVRNATKRYPHATGPALDDVSVDIAPGEFMTFLGPSGSGKTTTLSAIAGFTPLQSGSILIDDVDVSGLKPHRRDLGVVFQHYALFPHMTVAENIAYPLKQRRRSKAETADAVGRVLDTVHLRSYADRYPAQLSGGQQQRVALARAVVYEPRALLMDEPLGALDKSLRAVLQREISRMHEELGMTFVFVTHDQDEALALSDRIAVFNEGRIQQVGTAADLYQRPENLFVAEFIGESTVFTGTVESGSGMVETAEGPIGLASRGLAPSRPLHVIVRPENMRLRRENTSSDSRNVLQATLMRVAFGGGTSRATVRYASGSEGDVLVPTAESTAFSVGSAVFVEWLLPDQIEIPEESGSGS